MLDLTPAFGAVGGVERRDDEAGLPPPASSSLALIFKEREGTVFLPKRTHYMVPISRMLSSSIASRLGYSTLQVLSSLSTDTSCPTTPPGPGFRS
jgi:hypothetical protein